MLKGIIFDMDGTLTLTEPLHHQAFALIFKEYGIIYTLEEQVKKYAGTGARNIFTRIFEERHMTITNEEISRLIEKKKKLYKKIIQESEIGTVPGVHEFVQHVHQRSLKKIIATGNSDLTVVRLILEKVKLDEYFPFLASISEVPRGKPFPDIFLEAARRIACLPEECVVLEDAINGVKAARDAGIRAIALATTTSPQELLSSGASVVINDYTQLTDTLLYANS